MRTKENVKEILNHLQITEGEEFKFDEEAIIGEYQKNNANKSGLSIKILIILGGFSASLAFLGFLFITGLYNSDIGLFVFGIGFIAGAIWVNKKYDKLIIDTLSVSTFVIGYSLFGFGLSQLNVDETTISLIFMIIAFCSLSITQNYILSFTSVLIVNGSILALIIINKSYGLIHIYSSALALILTYSFLKEAKIISTSKKLSKLYNPVRTGLILSFLAGLVFPGKRGLIPESPNFIWLSSLITILAILYLISILFKVINLKTTKHRIIIYAISFILLMPTLFSPAISGSILIILLSFLVNFKTGLALGIVTFIYFISQYYYDLNLTLLIKSEILFSSGILFLLLYLFTHKKLATNEKI